MRHWLFLLVFLAPVLFPVAFAASHLPPGLLNLQESVKLDAVTNLRNVSFAIAFLAGILSIFSPCTIAVLPAFLSYTFKEKREIAKMTGIFFLGFSLAFIILGLLIAYLGKVSFVYFQGSSSAFIQAIGFLLILFGILTILGRGFTFVNIGLKTKHDVPGVFLFGALFAVGWSACSGPVIAGILSIAAVLNNYIHSAMLLFFYSLGIAIPLFITAFMYDKYNLAENKWIKGKEFKMALLGQHFEVHTTKAVSGILLMALGLLFLIYRGTTILTTADLFGRLVVFSLLLLAAYVFFRIVVKRLVQSSNLRHISFAFLLIGTILLFLYFDSRFIITTVGYAEFFDRLLLQNVAVFNSVGVALLVLFVYACWHFIFRRKK